jgi:hypothetical protein|tara:strand:- start:11 stop:226 length:216 start_codon:yes stop_codon:yes gene_type:complete
MEKKKSSTRNYKKPEMVIEEKVEKVIPKPKLVKKKYTLITDVPINGITHKKGSIFELTKEGAQYFKQQFYI